MRLNSISTPSSSPHFLPSQRQDHLSQLSNVNKALFKPLNHPTTMVSLAPTLRRTLLRRVQLRHIRGLATASDTRPQPSFDNRVKIVEVGPRDGLQNEKKSIPVATKIELIERLAKTGLTAIEAGSFVSPKWVPQVYTPLIIKRSNCKLIDIPKKRCNPPPRS